MQNQQSCVVMLDGEREREGGEKIVILLARLR